jgi:hypothetical protein
MSIPTVGNRYTISPSKSHRDYSYARDLWLCTAVNHTHAEFQKVPYDPRDTFGQNRVLILAEHDFSLANDFGRGRFTTEKAPSVPN